jgi:hypothetical protein
MNFLHQKSNHLHHLIQLVSFYKLLVKTGINQIVTPAYKRSIYINVQGVKDDERKIASIHLQQKNKRRRAELRKSWLKYFGKRKSPKDFLFQHKKTPTIALLWCL